MRKIILFLILVFSISVLNVYGNTLNDPNNVTIHQNTGTIEYKDKDININLTLQLNITDVFSNVQNNLWFTTNNNIYKFGWNRVYDSILFVSDKRIQSKYIITSDKMFNIDNDNSMLVSNPFIEPVLCGSVKCNIERYKKINFRDVTELKYNCLSDHDDCVLIYDPEHRLIIRDNSIELLFYSYYDTSNRLISIDPQIIIVDVSTTDSILENITAENKFTHISISNISPIINTSNLIAYYSFDTNLSSTRVEDYTINNNNGIINNNAHFIEDGAIGGAFDFDGENDYLRIDNNGNSFGKTLCDNGCTICAWAKPRQALSPQPQLISRYDTTGSNRFFTLRTVNNSNLIRASFTVWSNGAGAVANAIGATELLNNVWIHECGTYNGSNTTPGNTEIYLNGVSDNVSNIAIVVNSTAWSDNEDVMIGIRDDGTFVNDFNGSIDEAMIFNRTLTASEVLNIYLNQTARFFSRGEQIFEDINVSTGGAENRLNITINSSSHFNSVINVSVGNLTGGVYVYDNEYSFTNNFVSNIIISNPDNISLKFIFYAGNSTSNIFYSPTLENNITLDSFIVVPINSPVITNARINDTTPALLNSIVKINASITDINNNIDTVVLIIDPPNDPPFNTTVENISNEFFNDSIILSQRGQWTFTFFANDTTGLEAIQVIAQDGDSNNFIQVNTPPYFILNFPENDSIFRINEFDIVINVSVFDDDIGDNISTRIFGTNQSDTSQIFLHGLLYQNRSTLNNTDHIYNWTSPVTIPDNTTLLMFHLDNRSELDENNTKVVDFSNSSRQHNASLEGNVINFSQGKFGGGFTSSGSQDFVSIDDGAQTELDYGSTDLTTWTMWVKLETINRDHSLIAKATTIAGSFGYIILIEDNNVLSIARPTNIGDNTINLLNGTRVLIPNEWYHIAVVHNKSTDVSFYINGVLDVRGDATGLNKDSNTGISIGGSQSNFLDGTIDEVAIWDRLLSSIDIKNLYRLNTGTYFWNINISDDIRNLNTSLSQQFTIGDPCEYSGGNYLINCTSCNRIVFPADIGNNSVIMTESGNVSLETEIFNWSSWDIHNPCIFDIEQPFSLSSDV